MKEVKALCKQALNKNKTNFTPYSYDLNIYRGCVHRCEYCYALYSHKFLDDKNFYSNIYYKENITSQLDKELSKKKLKNEIVGVGTVCDSYQPIEKKLKLTKQCLEVFLKYKTPIYLSTKSDLILRDVEILGNLSAVCPICLCVSIISLDEKLIKKLEPCTPTVTQRLNTLKELKQKTSALVGIHLMPIIPYLTDDFENIKNIFIKAKELDLDFVVCDCLNLYGETKKNFLNFIKINFPEIYEKIKNLYLNYNKLKEYRENIRKNINSIKKELKFKNKYIKNYLNKKNNFVQLSLFNN